ncbi:hypothetical protein TSAR_011720 [Trichomalopsis sarcophagae]|uniref:Uncharacterized protein n=1 Tax=Trichomalopsis sarcophagae TaxID=543379 RepID=A0A232FCN1_9HYME|nr:hypothetical protein TSAR_011720 [Trichomalopsis sarcophagae]
MDRQLLTAAVDSLDDFLEFLDIIGLLVQFVDQLLDYHLLDLVGLALRLRGFRVPFDFALDLRLGGLLYHRDRVLLGLVALDFPQFRLLLLRLLYRCLVRWRRRLLLELLVDDGGRGVPALLGRLRLLLDLLQLLPLAAANLLDDLHGVVEYLDDVLLDGVPVDGLLADLVPKTADVAVELDLDRLLRELSVLPVDRLLDEVEKKEEEQPAAQRNTIGASSSSLSNLRLRSIISTEIPNTNRYPIPCPKLKIQMHWAVHLINCDSANLLSILRRSGQATHMRAVRGDDPVIETLLPPASASGF